MTSRVQQYIDAVAQLHVCGENSLVSLILFGSAATFVCIRSRTWPLNMRRFAPQLNVLVQYVWQGSQSGGPTVSNRKQDRHSYMS